MTDNKFESWMTYIDYLHRIGRRVGYNSHAKLESMKMTRVEQEILSGLFLKNSRESIIKGFSATFIDDLKYAVQDCLSNSEMPSPDVVCALFKNHIVERYYDEIDNLLSKHTSEIEMESVNGLK